MAHVDGACGAAEYADDVKESRKAQHPLRFGQSPREDRLQHNAADQSDEGKCLPHAGEQLSAVEILCRPGTAVLGIQPSSECGTSKADGEQKPWVLFTQQQKRSDKHDGYKG